MQKSAISPKTLPWTRYVPVALAIGAGVGLSLAGFALVRQRETREIRTAFIHSAEDRVSIIRGEIQTNLHVLESVRCLYRATPDVERESFRQFVKPLLLREAAIQAVEWIPRIPDAERKQYEAAAKRDGLEGFQITERDARGHMVRASRRDEYFPVYFVEPYQGNEAAVGFDLASDPTRQEALFRSRDTGETVTTARIRLVQETGDRYGFLIFLPVYGEGLPTDTVEDRRENLRGFVLGAFRAANLVERDLSQLHPQGIDVLLSDMSAPPQERLLYAHWARTRQNSYRPSHDITGDRPQDPSLVTTFEVGGCQWSIRCTPAPGCLAAQRTWAPWGVLAGGLMIAGLLAAYFSVNIGRTARIEALVEKRTDELRRSRGFLQTVIDAIPKVTMVIDRDRRVALANRVARKGAVGEDPAAKRLMCYRVSHGRHNPCDDVTCPCPLEQVSATKAPVTVTHIHHDDGKETYLEVSAAPIFDDAGEVIQVVESCCDITERKRAEQALRESEERFRRVAEQSPSMIFINSNGRIVYANPKCEEVMGYRRDEFYAADFDFLGLIAPECREEVKSNYEKHVQGQEVGSYEYAILSKEGKRIGAIITTKLINYGGQKAILGTVTDITDLKHAEKALRESEQKYRALVERSLQGIVVLQDLRICFANAAAAEIVGLPIEQLLALSPADVKALLHPGERARALHRLRDRLAGKAVPSQYDFRIVRRNDEVRWLDVFVSPIEYRGRPAIQAAFIDITQRKRAEEDLRLKDRAIASSINGIAIADLEGNLTYANDTFLRLWGYDDRKDVLGEPAKGFWQSEQEALRTIDALHDRGGWVGEMLARRKDGSLFDVQLSASMVVDQTGKPACMMASFVDITDRKRAEAELARAKEAAEAANRAKTEFLANISHEIRTPMTAVLGYADLLASPDLSERERQVHLQTVRRNGEVLLELINDVLDLSKIEAGRMTVEESDCSLWQVVEDIASLMRVRALGKDLGLEVDYTPPLPETIRTDPARLRQILMNLVGNAIKFTEQGGVRITVRCTSPQDPSPRVHFIVEDTGIGMSPEQLARLFRPFTQADTSTTRRFGGTGLGLAISKRLAERLGGDIHAQSRPGCGSTFTLSIDPGPLEGVRMLSSPPQTAAEEPEHAKQGEKQTLRGRVLLAEDGKDVQQLICFILEEAGLQVELAPNGRIAYQKASASAAEGNPYDLILMDIQMPELDGYEVTRRLRKDGWSGPILALTAHAMAHDREKCLRAGCNGYAAKPIDRTGLLASVARHLGQVATADLPTGRQGDAAVSEPSLISSKANHPVLADLLEEFLAELPDRAGRIDEALRSLDFPAVAELAHQLKGAAGIYGFAPIADLAQVVNRAAAEGTDGKHLQAVVAELVDLCRRAARGRSPSGPVAEKGPSGR